MVLRKILQGGIVFLAVWSTAYAITSDKKMRVFSLCTYVADASATIQTGRRFHKDTLTDFMMKVPRFLAQNRVSVEEINMVKKLAIKVFALPIELSPIEVYTSVYTLCIDKVREAPLEEQF